MEEHIGNHQPRHFSVDSVVMIHDLCPNATEKWCKGIITKVLGPLNYEVNIAGYTRQAHIDHIPCPQTTDSSSPGNISSHQDDDIIMPIVSCEASTDAALSIHIEAVNHLNALSKKWTDTD